MNTVTTKDGDQIFYKDWGQGQPIVFHHGWPLSSVPSKLGAKPRMGRDRK